MIKEKMGAHLPPSSSPHPQESVSSLLITGYNLIVSYPSDRFTSEFLLVFGGNLFP